MNYKSIKTKITLGFIITFTLFIALFIFYMEYEKKEFIKKINSHYQNISHHLFVNRASNYESENYILSLGFKKAIEPIMILKEGKKVSEGKGYELFIFKDNYYFHSVSPHYRMVFIDLNKYYKSYTPYFIFFVLFSILLFLYIWILKAFKPLEELKNEIQKFASGDLEISCKSSRNDEIAQVANEFDNAVNKISLLLKSRQLFLRTIMHELKTPIAKGRIVSELIENDKQKSRMIAIFDRLNLQIDDFAKVEQIISKNYTINISSHKSSNIIKKSIDMLMLENSDKIKIEIQEDKDLKVDLELISMALKNLLDNGLKYSSDKQLFLRADKNSILVISKGKKLQKPLEEYFKPFHNDTENKNHGMGLGLYIVYSILELHNYKFEYEYKEDLNIFKILF